MGERRRVLLVYSHWSSFVRNDHAILSEHYEVERFPLTWHRRLSTRLRDTHLALIAAIRRADLVYWWFMSDYSGTGAVYAKVARTPFVGIAGGWDVADEPASSYGRLATAPMSARWSTRTALRLADLVLSVSPLNHTETRIAGRRGLQELVPNGVDVDLFRPDPSATTGQDGARPLVVAVGAVNQNNLKVKGQWMFAEASRLVPEADFLLIGGQDHEVAAGLAARGGPNLRLPGYVPDADLLRLLRSAQVVCQLSWHESFGMGLVEAVACGCVPVYSDARIGAASYLEDAGHTVPYGDVPAAAQAVRAALEDARDPGVRDRMHAIIRRNIPLARRRREILELLRTLM